MFRETSGIQIGMAFKYEMLMVGYCLQRRHNIKSIIMISIKIGNWKTFGQLFIKVN